MEGIYSITNKVNGKRYIGLSTNIKKRVASHKDQLKYNRHENTKLQRA
ncbi:GIY-YIG nuclease family protein [Clostridium chrysemydis]